MTESPRAPTTALPRLRKQVRKLQRDGDETLQFDAMQFQGMDREQICELRKEVQHRSKVSNGTAWRRDIMAARGMTDSATAASKRSYAEGSLLVLYSKPANEKHVCTPRIEPEASLQKRFGDKFVTPGPGEYHPRPPPSRINNRFVGFLPQSPSRRLATELDALGPCPQSYNPHRPLGAEAPKCSIKKRPDCSTQGVAEMDRNVFATPASYVPKTSSFDVNRQMPNGATTARFYVAREMSHHSPGPTDTAQEGVTSWLWRDKRDRRWRPIGRADALCDFAPPASVVGSIMKVRAATAQKQDRDRRAGAAAGAASATGRGDEDAGERQQQQQQQQQQQTQTRPKSQGARSQVISHLHHPALLLLHELHKRGLQLVRFAVESGSGFPAIHFATKFQIADGFSLKAGIAVKDTAVLNAAKYVRIPKEEEPKDEKSTATTLEEKHRASVQCAISSAADAFIAANSQFAQRAKGRDFTYCAWLAKVLSSQLQPGDVPMKLGEPDKLSGSVHAVTAGGCKNITAPPIK